MHFHIMLWKSKFIIIKIRTYLLDIYLAKNVVFIPRYIVKDDISSKTIRIWLRNALECMMLYFKYIQSLKQIQIFIIKIRIYLLFIYLVQNVGFTPECHVNAIQDDITVEADLIWLHHALVFKPVQCDAIRWEQFWRRCRLGFLLQGISGRRQHLANMFGLFLWWL